MEINKPKQILGNKPKNIEKKTKVIKENKKENNNHLLEIASRQSRDENSKYGSLENHLLRLARTKKFSEIMLNGRILYVQRKFEE